MTSTYSPDLRLELMATGDQSGTWGSTTNTNLGTLLEQAICGVLSVAEGDTTLTLTANNGSTDQARNAVVILTGAMTADHSVVVPTSQKLYLVKNSTTGGFNIVVKTSGGSGVTIAASTSQWVYCDGTNVVQGLVSGAAGALAVSGGGTGLTAGTSGGILGFTGTTTIASSVLLTANALLLGGGADATPVPMGSLGTTTTVLHGNAAGAPTFGSISLTADITGTLAAGNGGTGVTSLASGIPSFLGTGSVATLLGYTPYNAAGGTISGNVAVSGTLNTSSTLSENGNRVYSAANPPPGGSFAPIPASSTLPVGVWVIGIQVTGSSIGDGGTVAGSNLTRTAINNGPGVASGATLSGTWQNIFGATINTGTGGLWVRIA